MKRLFLVVAVALLVNGAFAFPTGAPKSACKTMSPAHGDSVGQTTEWPVRIVLSKNQVAPGETISVRIESIDPEFQYKGFMLQPRNALDQETVVGTMHATDNSAKVTDCDGLNTATHVNTQPKSSTTVNWTAPQGFVGDVRFKLTIVQNFRTFWIDIISGAVEVRA